MNKNSEIKIFIRGNKVITRQSLLLKKDNFHKQQACLPFNEKIKIVYNLQKIAAAIKTTKTNVKN
ncbi:MAG: hypothetical protein AB1633_07125 [Elusimicrobiota bacterium]